MIALVHLKAHVPPSGGAMNCSSSHNSLCRLWEPWSRMELQSMRWIIVFSMNTSRNTFWFYSHLFHYGSVLIVLPLRACLKATAQYSDRFKSAADQRYLWSFPTHKCGKTSRDLISTSLQIQLNSSFFFLPVGGLSNVRVHVYVYMCVSNQNPVLF